MMLLRGKKLRLISKALEFKGVTAWIEHEKCSLFADLAFEANSR